MINASRKQAASDERIRRLEERLSRNDSGRNRNGEGNADERLRRISQQGVGRDSRNRFPPLREQGGRPNGRPPPRGNHDNAPAGLRCYKCEGLGHYANVCPNGNQGAAGGGATGGVAQDGNRPRCTYCDILGHLAVDCRRRIQNERSEPRAEASGPAQVNVAGVRVSSARVADNSKAGYSTYLEMSVEGVKHDFLLDTGCEASVVPASYVDCRGVQPSDVEIYAANGAHIPTLGQVNLELQLGDMFVHTNVQVSEHVTEAMLGIEWLTDSRAHWDLENGVITLEGNVFPLKWRPLGGRVCRNVARLTCPLGAFRKKRLKANSRPRKPGLQSKRVVPAVPADAEATTNVSPADALIPPVARRKRGRWRPRPVVDKESKNGGEELVRLKRHTGSSRQFGDFV